MAWRLFVQAGLAIHLPFLSTRFFYPPVRSRSITCRGSADAYVKNPQALSSEGKFARFQQDSVQGGYQPEKTDNLILTLSMFLLETSPKV